MKRFVLFSGEAYYPNGGMDDYVGSFDTLADAKEAVAVPSRAYPNWGNIGYIQDDGTITNVCEWVEGFRTGYAWVVHSTPEAQRIAAMVPPKDSAEP